MLVRDRANEAHSVGCNICCVLACVQPQLASGFFDSGVLPQFGMPPKKPSTQTGAVVVDGVRVPYSIDLKSKLVVVGTGVVANSERDTFRLKASPSLEQQVVDRPKWQSILAAAMSSAAATASASAESTPAESTAAPPYQPTPPAQSRELQALMKALPPSPPQQPASSTTAASAPSNPLPAANKVPPPLSQSRCHRYPFRALFPLQRLPPRWYQVLVQQDDGSYKPSGRYDLLSAQIYRKQHRYFGEEFGLGGEKRCSGRVGGDGDAHGVCFKTSPSGASVCSWQPTVWWCPTQNQSQSCMSCWQRGTRRPIRARARTAVLPLHIAMV